MLKIKRLALVSIALLNLSVTVNNAFALDSSEGDLYRERVVCVPQALTASDHSSEVGFGLDLAKAKTDLLGAAVQREYNIPGTAIRVSFSLTYVAAENPHVELTAGYLKRLGMNWMLLGDSGTPTVISLPIPTDTTHLIKAGSVDGAVPPYEVECKLERTRVDTDCATCR